MKRLRSSENKEEKAKHWLAYKVRRKTDNRRGGKQRRLLSFMARNSLTEYLGINNNFYWVYKGAFCRVVLGSPDVSKASAPMRGPSLEGLWKPQSHEIKACWFVLECVCLSGLFALDWDRMMPVDTQIHTVWIHLCVCWVSKGMHTWLSADST